MAKQSDIFPVCKMHPVLGSTMLNDYIVSIDFCTHVTDQNEIEIQQKCYSSDLVDDPMEVSNELMLDVNMTNGKFCSCFININRIRNRKMKIEMDAHLFSCLLLELERSRKFRTNVLANLYSFSLRKCKEAPKDFSSCSLCKRIVWIIQATVCLNLPKKYILDYKWCKKIEVLVNEKCELENAMAWLSTLGGAFSALGDHFIECAEKAGLISVQQFQMALRLGDPLTICRCKIYLAMSLLQRGYYGKTKRLIQGLYKFSIGPEGSRDFRLRNMCIAVWNRLKYELSLKKARCPCDS